MKRVVIGAFATLSILLAACSSNEATDHNVKATDKAKESYGTQETYRVVETMPSGPGWITIEGEEQSDICIFYKSASFSDTEYDAYLHHISTDDKIPENFICYEQLRLIGAFSRFNAPVYGHPTKGYDYYLYDFVDECGQPVCLTVEAMPKSDLSDPEKATTAVDSRDMRYLTEEKSGWSVYSAGDINYCYIDGALYYIEWYANDLRFHIMCEYEADVAATTCNYPADCSGTFMSEMLSLETADEALEKFLTAINAPIPET